MDYHEVMLLLFPNHQAMEFFVSLLENCELTEYIDKMTTSFAEHIL